MNESFEMYGWKRSEIENRILGGCHVFPKSTKITLTAKVQYLYLTILFVHL